MKTFFTSCLLTGLLAVQAGAASTPQSRQMEAQAGNRTVEILFENRIEKWVADTTKALNRGSKVAQTALGPVEYEKRGSGPVVICLHGAPGGYDQSSLIGEHLIAKGFTVIGVSRPGYLRTPLSAGESAEEQADAMIALMDTLGIDQAAAVGFSAGSLVAFQMGAKYGPNNGNRIWACVLQGVGAQAGDDDFYDILRLFLGFDFLLGSDVDFVPWLVSNMIKADLYAMTQLALSNDMGGVPQSVYDARLKAVWSNGTQRAFARRFLNSLLPLSLRNDGFLNDVKDAYSIDPWTQWVDDGLLQDVKTPMLVVQSINDSNGNFEEAHDLIVPSIGTNDGVAAQLLPVEESGHFLWLGKFTAVWQKQMVDFLKTNKPAAVRRR